MKEQIWQAALAGLLHDIGKFAQRAGEQVSNEWRDNRTQQEFKYQHALHTWHFINKYVPASLQAGALAAHHHRPQNAYQARLRLADQLSSGERSSGEARDDSDRKQHPRQLRSIFGSLWEQEHELVPRYFPLDQLQLKREVIFASERALPESQAWTAYATLWEAFCEEALQLKKTHASDPDPVSYLESMQALLQRYTWCIPAAYFNAEPDISLYDHGRMTAALAVILQSVDDQQVEALQAGWNRQGREQVTREDQELLDKPLALLVGGDISGIQDFIYTISSKGAARALRGRSFYLQLLTEAVLRFVLHKLELPYTNVIYSGGGHFYLLAPMSAAGALPAIQAEVTRRLLEHHGTALYLALGSAAVPASGFALGQFPAHWEAMHRNLSRAKQQRYTELGDEMHTRVFAVPEKGGNPDATCSVCSQDDRPVSKWDEQETQERICSLCRSFVEDLGRELPHTRYLLLAWEDPVWTEKGNALDALRAFGMQVHLLRGADWPQTAPTRRVSLWALDDPGNGWPGPVRAARWLGYSVNQIPVDKKGQPVTFDDLQKKCNSGFQRLGVLRMDVDNLGEVFSQGLGAKASLSRLSALSSQLSLFFEGWLKRLIEKDSRGELVYAVYAGGDDLFLLGPWDIMPALALEIADEFARYSSHPRLTLSGGQAFIHGKYPIYQAAEDAGEAEAQAKKHPGKAAFSFLGQVWGWDDFRQMQETKDTLVRVVQGTDEAAGGPKSLLNVLRQFTQMQTQVREKHAEKDEVPVWGRWMWMGDYHLTRAVERNKKRNPALARQVAALQAELRQTEYQDLPQWGVAARWAQLELRKTRNGGKE